jgi:hypothetical protein
MSRTITVSLPSIARNCAALATKARIGVQVGGDDRELAPGHVLEERHLAEQGDLGIPLGGGPTAR